ncbi:MAG: hypothetical protein KAH00_05085 [Cocleimonas sp.]|nr:hypothetical protein [Cocleimonas sp.]
MKKLPLAIAITSLLTISTSFALDSSDPTTAQIFTKAFEVSVQKESEIIVEPPKSEIIQLDAEKLEDIVSTGDNIGIGSMVVETNAKSCYATIRTMNNFKLQGEIIKPDGTKNTLASYSLYYTTQNDIDSTDSTVMSDVQFSSNSYGEMPVGCNTADLKMKVFKYNRLAPVDAYNDIITVEVRAES